jgi:predicted transcriptional regulator
MATEPRPLISDNLLHQVEETARAQNREPSDLVEEALGRYLASHRLASFAEKIERRATQKGIREEDVPDLVEEVRHENEALRR